MGSASTFAKEFFRHPQEVGGLFANTRYTARALIKNAALHRAKTIVELGPGTGSLTREIVKVMPKGATLIGLEVNKHFVKMLQKEFPKHHFYHADATEIAKYLRKHKRESCEVIVSGIPYAALPEDIQDALLKSSYDALDSRGILVTPPHIVGLLSPRSWRFWKKLKSTFSEVEQSIEWRNIPPALIYTCKK